MPQNKGQNPEQEKVLDIKSTMLIAVVVGAILGIVSDYLADPITNYYPLMVVFAMVEMSIALLVLLAIFKIRKWLKT